MQRVLARWYEPRRQQGVVLFIALIAMAVLSLAGVALIRSMNTTGTVTGNIALREASVTAVNLAVEQAVDWIYVNAINTETDVDVAHHYYGKLQAGELPNGIPAVLSGTYSAMKGTYPFGAANTFANDTFTSPAEVRSVIERVCSNAAPVPPAPGVMTQALKLEYCDMLPPKVSVAKTSMKIKGPTLPPIPLYRVTVRVDLPGTNTTTYAQAMLH